ncbi:MAG TPA: DUF1345 domain-containing protein [Acetobacteraceae bacterium]|nr:DUF1345 domain-containing protein [Acetobacteraceae bacterium]
MHTGVMTPFYTVWRALRARPFLLGGTAAGIVAWFLLPRSLAPLTRAVLGWDIGVLLFLAASAARFATADPAQMPAHAAEQEEGEWTIFALTVSGVAFSFAAIVGEFSAIGPAGKGATPFRLALLVVTLLASWLMTHVTFAYRYAHEYYATSVSRTEVDAGLQFPDESLPDYWDFLYFSLVLGMTFQVSDVQITSRKLRRLATVHGVLSFLFNTVILALSVNLAAGLL